MHHIVYQSCAVGHPSLAELRQLLRQARANNDQLGITGLLLYGNDSFLQVLEGEAAVVQNLYARIRADYRHAQVVTLADGGIADRIFPNWSMGFQGLSAADFVRLTGYINPHRTHFLDAHLPAIEEGMLCLLKSFVVDNGARL
ncbi:BLUF domain-containing protein [Hymenobacter algoricola]|uniref:BLUF domain-containing protein n=1 Tax=Hymenobacter algoricola TaxID=486267 RepID=A0ABP7MSB7_9BACT